MFKLSDIKKIDTKKINPHAQEAQARAEKICKEAGIQLPHFDSYNMTSAFFYPDAPLERLVAVIIIMNFLFYIDDVYERHVLREIDEKRHLREILENCVQIMSSGDKPHDTHELYDTSLAIHQIVAPLTNKKWLQRFTTSMQEHLNSSTYTLGEDFISQNDDAIGAYITFRELDSAIFPAMYLIEFANDFYLPDRINSHPYILNMEKFNANVFGLMNDIFSYQKEVIQYNSRFNLVALLEDYRGLSFSESVHEAVKIVNQNTEFFLEQEQQVPDFGNKEYQDMTIRYIKGLRDQINAAWYWQITTDRYRSVNSPHPELRIPAPTI